MIIDTHAHFGMKRNQEREAAGGPMDARAGILLEDMAALRAQVGAADAVEAAHVLLEDYLEAMERNGIERAWIHQLSFQSVLGYDVLPNHAVAEAVRKHKKLRGFAGVNPHAPDAVGQLREAVEKMGLHGLKLNPNDYGGFFPNDRKWLYPLYDECCKLKIPVSIHTGITPSRIFRMGWNNPLLLDDVAVDFPDLTILVEHMGFPWLEPCGYMVGRHKNMYVTVTAVANLLAHEKTPALETRLAQMKALAGSKKMLWGSDWTATPNLEETLARLKRLDGKYGFTGEDTRLLLGGNAERILA